MVIFTALPFYRHSYLPGSPSHKSRHSSPRGVFPATITSRRVPSNSEQLSEGPPLHALEHPEMQGER